MSNEIFPLPRSPNNDARFPISVLRFSLHLPPFPIGPEHGARTGAFFSAGTPIFSRYSRLLLNATLAILTNFAIYSLNSFKAAGWTRAALFSPRLFRGKDRQNTAGN